MIALKRSLARGHLVQNHAEGEQIGACVQWLAARLLGRHPVLSARPAFLITGEFMSV
jgi:hypothetical protein